MVRTNIYGPYHGGISCHKKEVLEHYESFGKFHIDASRDVCSGRNGKLFDSFNASLSQLQVVCQHLTPWSFWINGVSGNCIGYFKSVLGVFDGFSKIKLAVCYLKIKVSDSSGRGGGYLTVVYL